MLGPTEELIMKNENSENTEKLQLIHRNTLRLLKLVNSLLDFSRIEAERYNAAFSAVDLKIVCEDLASVFRSACDRVGLKLIVDCQRIQEVTSIRNFMENSNIYSSPFT